MAVPVDLNATLIDALTMDQLKQLRAACVIAKPATTVVATTRKAYVDLLLTGMVLDLAIAAKAEG